MYLVFGLKIFFFDDETKISILEIVKDESVMEIGLNIKKKISKINGNFDKLL